MSQSTKIDFIALAPMKAQTPPQAAAKRTGKVKSAQTLVIFMGQDFAFGAATAKLIGAEGEALIRRAAATVKFKGKPLSALDIVAPAGFAADRLLVIGVGAGEAGKAAKDKEKDKDKRKGGKEAANDAQESSKQSSKQSSEQSAAKLEDCATLGGYLRGKLGPGAFALVVFDLP